MKRINSNNTEDIRFVLNHSVQIATPPALPEWIDFSASEEASWYLDSVQRVHHIRNLILRTIHVTKQKKTTRQAQLIEAIGSEYSPRD
jgi:hypothetical protein